MPEVDVFLIGVPKAGTTWLAYALDQHKEINLSVPKEPNIIASHRGTFIRTDEDPDWGQFDNHFNNKGLKLDASIHAFSCPLAPSRIYERLPNAKFILCLREPVARSFSHWNMVLNTKESELNGNDWSTFEKAWKDEHLRCDSMYGSSMSRWLEQFNLDRFLIIDSANLKNNPSKVLKEVENFLVISPHSYDLSSTRHSNAASNRRPITSAGKLIRTLFSIIPNFIKSPIVRSLQKRDFNIYNFPLLSKKGVYHEIGTSHYDICGNELVDELKLFQKLTGFSTNKWVEEINLKIIQQ